MAGRTQSVGRWRSVNLPLRDHQCLQCAMRLLQFCGRPIAERRPAFGDPGRSEAGGGDPTAQWCPLPALHRWRAAGASEPHRDGGARCGHRDVADPYYKWVSADLEADRRARRRGSVVGRDIDRCALRRVTRRQPRADGIVRSDPGGERPLADPQGCCDGFGYDEPAGRRLCEAPGLCSARSG